jgi:trans-aconitate methyltransferase
MAELDYAGVKQFWSKARPSILGPYMMDGYGFPAGAGRFRFRAESRIVSRLIGELDRSGAALDLGCGVGYWAEYFAGHFAKVVAIEASLPLYEATRKRCSPYANVEAINADVMALEPEDRYELVFLGGMLMYLNENDVISLLQKLTPFLNSGGIILCRETTVRSGTVTRQGEYQAVYRSVSTYREIFQQCGLSVKHVETNVPYVLMQMGCELVKKWKAIVPRRLQLIDVVGRLTYWAIRMGNPWIARVPTALGRAFPELTNHFFVLRAGTC